ncbi:hypothetical protein [Streptomyces sp. MA5143a]|uniref:hypothetical protein n=1 Tax=Streptomyces sp. MA5143a TaxID=2083010 RepID=UPI0011B1FDAD|nr:hypothetical protein [Streptomyces sp. MA5143a]
MTRALAAAVAAAAMVVSLAGCDDKDQAGTSPVGRERAGEDRAGEDQADESVVTGQRNGGATSDLPGGLTTRQKLMLDNLPESGAVMAAGEYLQRFTTCERYSIDPADTRYYPMDEEFDESWGVRFRGTCDDAGDSYIRVFWTGTDGMKTFQEAYRADIAERVKKSPSAGIDGGFAIGRDFAVIAPDPDTVRQLSSSFLLVLNCNPNFEPVGDTSTAPAQVDGCVLTDDFTD